MFDELVFIFPDSNPSGSDLFRQLSASLALCFLGVHFIESPHVAMVNIDSEKADIQLGKAVNAN